MDTKSQQTLELLILKVDQVIEGSTDPHTLHFSLSPLRAAIHKVCACYSAPVHLHVVSAAASEECDLGIDAILSKTSDPYCSGK